MANDLGFENGDKFLSADGEKIERFSDVVEKILLSKTIVVERDGITTDIKIPIDIIDRFLNNERQLLFYPRVPSVVGSLNKGSNAEKAGLKENDILIGINNNPINYHDEFKMELANNKGENVLILVNRGEVNLSLVASVNQDGLLGFNAAIPSLEQLEQLGYYSLASDEYTFFSSLPAGYNKAVKKLSGYIDQFMLILTPSSGAYKGLGGFGAIGSLFPATWDWEVFWNLTAFLSLMLAFLNILPIPALDGGHVVFLLYEMIIGRPAPEKMMEFAQVVGMILLLSLVIFANGNDILRFF
jgi:regulator of sigma E protease